MHHHGVINPLATRKDDRCDRCRLYAGEPSDKYYGCYHPKDVLIVPVRRSGSFAMVDMVPPEQLAALARWTNNEERKGGRVAAVMRRIGGK